MEEDSGVLHMPLNLEGDQNKTQWREENLVGDLSWLIGRFWQLVDGIHEENSKKSS